MAKKIFRDDASARSEGGRGLFFRGAARDATSSQSVSAMSAGGRSFGGGGLMRKLRRSGGRFRRNSAIDDVSVSDSLCSGVLRGEPQHLWPSGGVARSSVGSAGGASVASGSGRLRSRASMMCTENSDTTRSLEGSASHISRVAANGVANFDPPGAPSVDGRSQHADDDASTRRGQRNKDKVREKLERYKRDQRQLRHSCEALEQQLAQTTEKLKEVDSRAASKIGQLEGELRDSRKGMGHVARESTRAVSDQGEAIKSLGKKLIRQAHVIKKQKRAMAEYKAEIEAMQEEMHMQDERDSKRAAEYCRLRDDFENVSEQKSQIQAMLQENIEELMDLKNDTMKDAKITMELKFAFEQKEETLDQMTKELSEKADRARTLELELEEKGMALDDMNEKLKVSKTQVEAAKNELARVNKEVDDLRARCQTLEKANSGGWSMLGSLKEEVVTGASKESGECALTAAPSEDSSTSSGGSEAPPVARQTLLSIGRSPSLMGWNRARDSMMDVETFENELEAKDATILALDGTVCEHEETIRTLKSDMVKMSSTYKQDSYLKRKEIAKLKQANAEYALKLRALEKAFKSIGGGSVGPLSTATAHGPPPSRRSSALGSGSLHSRSMHATERDADSTSREGKAAVVKARLGLGPCESPPAAAGRTRKRESQIVIESNFMDSAFFEDGNEREGEEESRGESPEEC